MANVKLSEKSLLEKIQAKILLIQGEKITQQNLLDKCIEFVDNNFDMFLAEQISSPKMTQKKLNFILKQTVKSGYHQPEKTHDELLYGRDNH